ncbi:MAG TPA: branched-chain amino acid ABC transporter permease [Methylomirabilota bacterium]|nr:branched-chain amino acid ABC transporter permease [Methylomirabilota bacterium]
MISVPASASCARVLDPRRLVVLTLVGCALALPFVLWGFRTYQLAFAATHAIAILGLNLITGQAGLISLGHGAFYGLGAYTMAVLMRQAGVSAYAGILAAGLACLVAGYVFGRIVARLARFYLALATFALALAIPQTLKSSVLAPWTGGVQGLYLDRPPAPPGLPLSQDQWWYFVTLGVLAVLLWMARNLVRSRTGRAIRAMRDHPLAAQVAGVDMPHYTAMVFAVGSAYAGVAGALAALLLDFIAPESFTYWLSILLLVGSVFGGMSSVWGAVAGGLFLQFWPDIAGTVSRNLAVPVFGALLVLSMWVMPDGVAGLRAGRGPRRRG